MDMSGIAPLVVSAFLTANPIEGDLNDFYCLTEAIYFESRGESLAGKAAVGLVIQNRVNSSRFPNTYCEVINQPWQFSYTFTTDSLVHVPNNRVEDYVGLQNSMLIAHDILNNELFDFTYGSMHYYNPRLAQPFWSRYGDVVAVVGGHKFINNMRR